MSRLSFGLVLIVGILAGGLGVSLLDRGPQPLGDTEVRGIVSEMMAAQKPVESPAELDPVQLNAMIEDYLMDDPAILERMSAKLASAKKLAQRETQAKLIAAHHSAIYDDTANVILGNPDGDVTLVEMFDYNCGYCRNAVPDVAALLAEDPNLKVILKEFPILSEGSVEAAKVALLVNEDSALDYWAFHQKLFATRGQIDAGAALAAAEAVGGNRMTMMIDMNSARTAKMLSVSYALAEALDVSGTPTYIIGDEVIPGAVGIDRLRQKIANMRECGSTDCDRPAG
jgi:protein-disulfide isomerase